MNKIVLYVLGSLLLLVWLYIAAKLITSGIIKAKKQMEEEDNEQKK